MIFLCWVFFTCLGCVARVNRRPKKHCQGSSADSKVKVASARCALVLKRSMGLSSSSFPVRRLYLKEVPKVYDVTVVLPLPQQPISNLKTARARTAQQGNSVFQAAVHVHIPVTNCFKVKPHNVLVPETRTLHCGCLELLTNRFRKASGIHGANQRRRKATATQVNPLELSCQIRWNAQPGTAGIDFKHQTSNVHPSPNVKPALSMFGFSHLKWRLKNDVLNTEPRFLQTNVDGFLELVPRRARTAQWFWSLQSPSRLPAAIPRYILESQVL